MQPGKPLPGIRSLMAVINSVGVGRGSKSVGEFTYRYTRGRTIASRRITKNTSKTPAQVGRRGAFGSFVWMFSPYKWFFSDGYEKTKHGSSFNQFVHVNRELLGKSPYNSEVNKKLIPNGTQLWKLVTTITDNSVPHLKYATYGTLPFLDSSKSRTSGYTYDNIQGKIYVEDFKGITISFCSIFSNGETVVKELNLYEDGDIPHYENKYSWVSEASKLSVTSDTENGTVNIEIFASALIAFLLNLTEKPSSTVTGVTNVFIKQYGKIASLKRFMFHSIEVSSLEEQEEKSSESVQEDNTEIK